MAKQNRDQDIRGGSQESGRPREQSEPERERKEQEHVKGSASEESQRPPRQPGRLPLPE